MPCHCVFFEKREFKKSKTKLKAIVAYANTPIQYSKKLSVQIRQIRKIFFFFFWQFDTFF